MIGPWAGPGEKVSMRSLLPALFLTIALAGSVTAAPAPNDNLIIPGERVGPIALGMTEAQLTAAMGGPGEVLHQGPVTTYSWGQVTAEIADNSPGVETITVNDQRYDTPGHVRVGLAATAAAAVLGQPNKKTSTQGLDTFDYDGLTMLARNNFVAQIRVHK
jgi:hypothetical protein